ncbi:MAG: metallophosphoesterase, partial [bacterium]
ELCTTGDTPEELYDLEISTGGIRAASRRAVKVIPAYKDEYSFVHITDVHIGCCKKVDQYSIERVLEHPSEEIFARVADEVNLINPEFVLISGDIVASAEGTARTQGKVEGTFAEDEFRDFLDILNRFEAPTFVLPGNHDLVGTQNRPLLEFWEKYFLHRYYSFTYGDAYFLGLDNSNAMEATTFLYPKASIRLDEEQREWLIGDLDRNVARALKIFFFHVNTNRQEIEKLADDYGAQLALFGHWHMDDVKTAGKTPTAWIQTKSLLEKGGYRLVRVKNNRIVSHSVDGEAASLTWKDIGVSFSPANDGAHGSVTAVIENRTTETFEGARLKFIMPKAESYTVSGGEIAGTEPFGEVIPGGEKAVVCVRTAARPGATTVTVTKK